MELRFMVSNEFTLIFNLCTECTIKCVYYVLNDECFCILLNGDGGGGFGVTQRNVFILDPFIHVHILSLLQSLLIFLYTIILFSFIIPLLFIVSVFNQCGVDALFSQPLRSCQYTYKYVCLFIGRKIKCVYCLFAVDAGSIPILLVKRMRKKARINSAKAFNLNNHQP